VGIPDEGTAVVRNGYVLNVGAAVQVGERVLEDHVFVDGALVREIGPRVMREREALGENGFVTVAVCCDLGRGPTRGRSPSCRWAGHPKGRRIAFADRTNRLWRREDL
jgi:mRNA degradation ribonuclease J1/J2